jgi:hypothetical protein
MKTIQQVEKQISDLSKARDALVIELGQIDNKIKAEISQLSEAVLAGKEYSNGSLEKLENRKKVLQGSIDLANEKNRLLNQELEDARAAVVNEKWFEFVKESEDLLREMQALTGAAGLKGKIDKLQRLTADVTQTVPGHQNFDDGGRITQYMFFCRNASLDLMKFWGELQAINQRYCPKQYVNQLDSVLLEREFGKPPQF